MKMLISKVGNFAPSWSALYEAFFYQIWLIHLFHCARVFAKCSGYGCKPHRPTLELVDYGGEKSRTRRNSALAMRGVPRLRKAISIAAESVIGTLSNRADRFMIDISIEWS